MAHLAAALHMTRAATLMASSDATVEPGEPHGTAAIPVEAAP